MRLLMARGIVATVADADIPRHRGQRVLQGGFLVEKPGRFIEDGRVVGRLIMDVRQTNALMICLQGDLPSMALPSQYLSLIVGEGEVPLWSGEDLVSSFLSLRHAPGLAALVLLRTGGGRLRCGTRPWTRASWCPSAPHGIQWSNWLPTKLAPEGGHRPLLCQVSGP